MATKETAFQYSPLTHPRQIRLLKVSRDPDLIGRIQCEFRIMSLDDLDCPYNAISYLWGPPIKTDRVWCNGQYIDVTASAMSILSKTASEPEIGYIWIDALCINQSDNAEKAVQVRLMRDVYASSNKVIGWLGNATPHSDEAIEFMYTLDAAASTLPALGGEINHDSLAQFNGCRYPSKGWTALSMFLENAWFERIWIVQEIVVAGEIDLVCGNKTIPWLWVARVLLFLMAHSLSPLLFRHREGELSISPKGIRGMINALSIRYFRETNEPPSLSWLLVNCWMLDATDGRDKLFALLGMASDAEDSDFEPYYEVALDGVQYKAAIEDVFRRSTVRLLTRDRLSNRVLHAAGVGHPRSLSALPSWVPDWTTDRPNTTFGAVAESASYRASGDISAPRGVSYDMDEDTITLTGCVLETVIRIAESLPKPIWQVDIQGHIQRTTAELAWLRDIQTILPQSSFHQNGAPYYPDVLCRTLISDTAPGGRRAPAEYVHYFEEYVAIRHVFVNTAPEKWGSAIPHERIRSTQKFTTAMYPAAAERRVFSTEDAYIGLGPPGVEKGDQICIFLGFHTPFIIRPREAGGYILVGECYIYGLMDGEGLKRGRVEDITLF